jgi:hypothetical protein
VLESLSFQHANIWEEVGKLVALSVGFRVIAYLALLFLRKEKLKLA